MQQRIVEGFLRAMADPRFQGLLSDFYALRDAIITDDDAPVRTGLAHLLDTIRVTLQDQHALKCLEGALDGENVTDALACIQGVEALALGPALRDAIVVLFLFQHKLGLVDTEENGGEEALLRRMDDHLTLLGLADVSLQRLWQNAREDLGEQRGRLVSAVRGLLAEIKAHCRCDLPGWAPA